MDLSAFKWIFFWEFAHRLWARSMGIVFLVPFVYFYWKGLLSRQLIGRLAWVIVAAALAATFGWLMVYTGIKGNDIANPRAWHQYVFRHSSWLPATYRRAPTRAAAFNSTNTQAADATRSRTPTHENTHPVNARA